MYLVTIGEPGILWNVSEAKDESSRSCEAKESSAGVEDIVGIGQLSIQRCLAVLGIRWVLLKLSRGLVICDADSSPSVADLVAIKECCDDQTEDVEESELEIPADQRIRPSQKLRDASVEAPSKGEQRRESPVALAGGCPASGRESGSERRSGRPRRQQQQEQQQQD